MTKEIKIHNGSEIEKFINEHFDSKVTISNLDIVAKFEEANAVYQMIADYLGDAYYITAEHANGLRVYKYREFYEAKYMLMSFIH